jgi:hypothetical protein
MRLTGVTVLLTEEFDACYLFFGFTLIPISLLFAFTQELRHASSSKLH